MLRVTVASLLAHRLRLIVTAVTIAIGVALVAGTFILTDSVQRALAGPMAAAPTALVVVQPAGTGGGKGAPAAASLPASLVARVRAVSGVASAEGLVTAGKVTITGPDGRPITSRRAVPELLSYPTIPALAAQYTIRSGHPPRGPGEALLDAATARRLGYHTGERVGVATADGVRTLTVVGITGFGGADSPAAAQVASLDTPTVLVVQPATAQRLAGLAGQFTEIDAEAATAVPAATLVSRLTRVLPPGAQAITGEQAAAQQAADATFHLGQLRTDLLAFCVVALLVAGFVIASTFSILTAQRTREYALLRVIGASRGQVRRCALAEAALLGLAASAAGVGLGAGAAAGLRGLVGVLGGTLPAGGLVFAPRTAVVALATGTVVTVVSAIRPARLAGRVRPIRALREALPTAVGRSRGRLAAGITGFAAAAALLVTGFTSAGSQNTLLAGGGALAAVIALVIAGPLLARPVARLVTAPLTHRRGWARHGWARRAGITAALARDNSAQNPYRTAATAAILAIGLAAAAMISVIAGSARASALDAVTSTSHADLYVQGSISPGLARAVAGRPGVLSTMRMDNPMVRVAGADARVDGIDPASAPRLLDFGVSGGTLAALHGNGLFVSGIQAARHGWHIGSEVTVDFGRGGTTFRVAGVFTDKRFFGDDYLMPITTLFHDMPSQGDTAGILLVKAAPGTPVPAVRAAVAAALAGSQQNTLLTPAGYQAAQVADLGDLSHLLGILTALVALTVLIAALGIASALTLAITERSREFAVLRALGLTRHQLAAMIRAESLITCLLGALPGLVIGVGAGAALAAALTRDQTGVPIIQVQPLQLATALALTCLAAVAAGALPARQAGRTPALQAIDE
jgi:putative ABC transport system permease protein